MQFPKFLENQHSAFLLSEAALQTVTGIFKTPSQGVAQGQRKRLFEYFDYMGI